MQNTDDVQRVLSMLRDYTTFGHWFPADLARMTIRTMEGLLKERDAAIRDMTEIVQEYGEPYCKYCGADFKPNCTGHCWTHNEGFRWRGVQKEG